VASRLKSTKKYDGSKSDKNNSKAGSRNFLGPSIISLRAIAAGFCRTVQKHEQFILADH
jgi:hypothetical protein